ncbi:MAG: hypothetical protein KF780_06115 [Sphingomonas sp.]|nr:hypothetical protein [Sphingomonas sp.]
MLLAAMLALQAPATVDDLGWMAGHWTREADGRWTEESWTAPRGGMMLGVSRSGRAEAVREFEFIRLQAGADGVPVYWASPGGRPPVAFRLASHGPNEAVFENPAHDFPQRIRYRREGETMTATISAIDGSNAMSWQFRRQ